MKKADTGFTAIANWVANAAGGPWMFLSAVGLLIAWAIAGPFYDFSEMWLGVAHTAAALITFLMVFLIQNSQNRDTASMQAKLDELLSAVGNAREHFIGIEHLPAGEVEKIRAELEREIRGEKGAKAPKRRTK